MQSNRERGKAKRNKCIYGKEKKSVRNEIINFEIMSDQHCQK